MNPLVHLGKTDLGKPANTFLKIISSVIGLKAINIRRQARAIRYSRLLQAETDLEIKDRRLAWRAKRRLQLEEVKRQQNIESTIEKALPLLNEDAHPEGMNEDWIQHFFENVRIVSDDQMRILWAKVLAREANSPGSSSKRTLAALSTLDKLTLKRSRNCAGSAAFPLPTKSIFLSYTKPQRNLFRKWNRWPDPPFAR